MFRLIRFLFFLIAILIITIYVLLLFVDLNHFKEPIERELANTLNREVTVDRINLNMSLVPSINVRDVTVYNSKDFDEKTVFAKVDELNLSLAIIPLFKGVVQVDDILINNGKIFLAEKDGKHNWDFSSKTSDNANKDQASQRQNKTSSLSFNRVHLQYISLKNLLVSYEKDAKKEAVFVQHISFTQMKNLFMHLQYKNEPIQATLVSETLLPAVLQNRLNDFVFNLKMRNADVNVAGTIGNLSNLDEIDLTINATTGNLKSVMTFLGYETLLKTLPLEKNASISFILTGGMNQLEVKEFKAEMRDVVALNLNATLKNITENLKVKVNGVLDGSRVNLSNYILKPVNLSFNVDFENKVLSITNTTIFIDKSDVELSAKIDLNQKLPMITGQLFSKYFNIEDVLAKDEFSLSENKGETGKVASETVSEFDLSFLKLFDANVKASFANLKLFDDDYHKASLTMQLKDGIMVVNPISFDLLSGNIAGQAVLNAATIPLSLEISLNAKGIVLSALDVLKPHIKDAIANIVVQLSAKGNTQQTLLENLNGTLQLQMPSGVIVNKWFNSLPTAIGAVSKNNAFSYSGSEYYSKLSCAALNLKIKDGVIRSDKNIALETSLINLAISGDIDLKKKYLSLSLIPSINQLNNKLNKKLSFAQYVKLQGPFNNIEMKEDVEGVLNAVAENKLTKLAEKVTGEELQKEELIPVGGLCRKAMGEVVTPIVEDAQSEPVQKQETKKEIVKEIKNSLEDQVKTKLEKSLSNILKKK